MIRVLKIGGSILTDKTRAAGARPEEIERVAGEIAADSRNLVLIHGAGSFGHIPARRYGLPERFSPEGLLVTHRSVVELNDLVVRALGREGVDAMPVHPFSCVLLQDGRIRSFATEILSEMIERGLLPVLHGDVAMDVARGAGIVSGDQLVPYLARALRASVVAIGTDVEGVLLSGRALPAIMRSDMPLFESALVGSTGVDVTGGMKGKLLELLDLSDDGFSSVIFDASCPGNIARALQGETVGTRVGSPP